MEQRFTPNFSEGRNGQKPEAIVLHIMSGTLSGTDSWFGSTRSGVSAHYGIGKNGEIHQYVKEEDTAWHGGVVDGSVWKLLKSGVNPNSYTIGIEHEGESDDVWTQEMQNVSAQLIKEICTRWDIPCDRDHIIGHYQLATKTRVNCPAVDKSIIDILIDKANAPTGPTAAISCA